MQFLSSKKWLALVLQVTIATQSIDTSIFTLWKNYVNDYVDNRDTEYRQNSQYWTSIIVVFSTCGCSAATPWSPASAESSTLLHSGMPSLEVATALSETFSNVFKTRKVQLDTFKRFCQRHEGLLVGWFILVNIVSLQCCYRVITVLAASSLVRIKNPNSAQSWERDRTENGDWNKTLIKWSGDWDHVQVYNTHLIQI